MFAGMIREGRIFSFKNQKYIGFHHDQSRYCKISPTEHKAWWPCSSGIFTFKTNMRYINNAEYNIINRHDAGVDVDKLCAVFIHLRAAKNGERRFNPKGRLKHFGLLKDATKLSRHVIEKYVPHLIKLGLVTLNKDGGVTIIGFNRSFKLFKDPLSRLKLIPVKLHQSYLDTAIDVAFTRVKSNLKNQKKQIDLKTKQIRLLNTYNYSLKHPQKSILSKANIKEAQRLIEKYGDRSNFKSKFCKETVLSLHGFSKLKNPAEADYTHAGKYFKKRLLKQKLIKTEIRSELIIFSIPAWQYFQNKEILQKEYGRGIYWCRRSSCVRRRVASKVELLLSTR